jgi:hypothetical protein
MQLINHKVLSTIMPRDKGISGNMSSVVRNEMAKAEAFCSTSIVHVKDKKVCTIPIQCNCLLYRVFCSSSVVECCFMRQLPD